MPRLIRVRRFESWGEWLILVWTPNRKEALAAGLREAPFVQLDWILVECGGDLREACAEDGAGSVFLSGLKHTNLGTPNLGYLKIGLLNFFSHLKDYPRLLLPNLSILADKQKCVERKLPA